jgi:hypothetical protein
MRGWRGAGAESEPVRVCALPAREGVGGKTRVYHRHVGHAVGVLEVLKVVRELVRGEHTLVRDGPARQRADVELLVIRHRALAVELRHPADAEQERLTLLFRDAIGKPQEELLHVGLARARRGSEPLAVVGAHGNLAPAEQLLPKFGDRILDVLLALRNRRVVFREKDNARRVLAGGGQRERARLAIQLVRDRYEHARAVAGLLLAPARASVIQPRKDNRRILHRLVRGLAGEIGDEAYPACILLVHEIVQALLLRMRIEVHVHLRVLPRHSSRGSPRCRNRLNSLLRLAGLSLCFLAAQVAGHVFPRRMTRISHPEGVRCASTSGRIERYRSLLQ